MKTKVLRVPSEGEIWSIDDTYYVCVGKDMRQLTLSTSARSITHLAIDMRRTEITSVRNIKSDMVADGIGHWKFHSEDWIDFVKEIFQKRIASFQAEIDSFTQDLEVFFENLRNSKT